MFLSRHGAAVALLSVSAALTLAAPARADKPDPLAPKLNAVVGFFNVHSENASRALDAYFRLIDFEAGPACATPQEATKLNSAGTSISYLKKDDVVDDLRGALKKKPAEKKLDAAGKDLVDAYEALATVMGDAKTYYQGEHRKDKCAKGQELHGKIKEASARFGKANAAVYEWLQTNEKARAQKALKEIEKTAGKKFKWHRQKTMIDARAMLDTLKAEARAKAPNAETVKTAVATFEPTVTALVDLEKKNHSKADQYGFSSFTRSCQTFFDSAKRFSDDLGAGKKTDFDGLVSRYNSLVDAHNQVSFDATFK